MDRPVGSEESVPLGLAVKWSAFFFERPDPARTGLPGGLPDDGGGRNAPMPRPKTKSQFFFSKKHEISFDFDGLVSFLFEN